MESSIHRQTTMGALGAAILAGPVLALSLSDWLPAKAGCTTLQRSTSVQRSWGQGRRIDPDPPLPPDLPTGLAEEEIAKGGWTGGYPLMCIGFSIAGVGDQDGDGVPDLLIGCPGNDRQWSHPGSHAFSTYMTTVHWDRGSVWMISGAKGARIRGWDGYAVGDCYGSAVAGAGDVDGDGVEDLLIGAPGQEDSAGYVELISGESGRTLQIVRAAREGSRFGSAIAGGSDLNGDGRPDFIVGAPAADEAEVDAGTIRAFDAASGDCLWTLHGLSAGAMLGSALALRSDVDGDGHADLIVGAPGSRNLRGEQEAGVVLVLSGRDQSVIHMIEGSAEHANFGYIAVEVGDVNGDGTADMAASSFCKKPRPQQPFDCTTVPLPPGRDLFYEESIAVMDGKNGSRLQALEGNIRDGFGASVCGSGDLDGDGLDDLLIGAVRGMWDGGRRGLVQAISPVSGKVLFVESSESRYRPHGYGNCIVDVGDVDGDGRSDFAVGAADRSLHYGEVEIRSGRGGRLIHTITKDTLLD